MNAMWFRANGVEGTRETAPAGHPVYTVTHTASGRYLTTDVVSLALRTAREWAAQAPTVALMSSPLPAAERCSSGLARGASLTMPSDAQARKLIVARDNLTRPGLLSRGGHEWQASITMLRALRRRGWITLNDPTRPTYGMINDSGRRALARYEASKVGAR